MRQTGNKTGREKYAVIRGNRGEQVSHEKEADEQDNQATARKFARQRCDDRCAYDDAEAIVNTNLEYARAVTADFVAADFEYLDKS